MLLPNFKPEMAGSASGQMGVMDDTLQEYAAMHQLSLLSLVLSASGPACTPAADNTGHQAGLSCQAQSRVCVRR